jgi:1-acyl-sn-glycerol-3-phosphate acyltransferase
MTAEGADCEERDTWFLDQDVNAWTSLAYVVVGGLVVALTIRRRLRPVFAVLGVLAVAEGVGSVLYHGGSGDAGRFLHDVALVAALGFVAGWHAGRLRGRADTGALAGTALTIVAGSIIWAAAPSSTNVMVGVLVAAIVVAELLARRRRMPAVWNTPLLALGVAALVVWWAGSPESPVCDGGSWVQPHGLWHTGTALLVLGWVDQASYAADPNRAPRLFRRATDRVIGLVATGLVLAFHRSVDVAGRQHVPRDRPVLVVANHGNGFVDPIVVTAVLRRLPRFLAKAALWKVVAARPFLGLAGVLPVHRASDGDRTADNRSMFESCHLELARGATVAIFPEGTTGDRASLDRVRSGAARIALGAVPTARDMVIVPIGLAFESYVETRSRALVVVGEPIDVAPFDRDAANPEPGREDVGVLTARIAAALESVSPEFATVEERDVFRAAARATLDAERRNGDAPFGEVDMLARRVAAADPTRRAGVVDAFRRYATRLQLIGVTDDQLGPANVSGLRLALSVLAVVAVGSLVVTAALIHLPALVLVVAASGAVRSTATKGTVRMLVGLVAGLATWIIAGIVIGDGAGAWLAGLTVAAEGALALIVWTPFTRLVSRVWGRLRVRSRAGLLPPVLEERARLSDAVREAAGV